MKRSEKGARGLRDSVLRRTATFSSILHLSRLSDGNTFLRYSLSRLSEHEEQETGHSLGADEWKRLQDAVFLLIQGSNLPAGKLTPLHEDVRTLQRSKTGPFIREYLQNRLLSAAGNAMKHEIQEAEDWCDQLVKTWSNYYSHVVPAIEAIFVNVQGQRLSVRHTTLVAFRDHVVLPLCAELIALLEDLKPSATPAPLRQMLLVLQSISECYPPSENQLLLESLVARAVSPYLGFRGLYENGNPEPVRLSSELKVAQQRRPSGKRYKTQQITNDPRRLLRPLRVTSGQQANTLAELLTFSAHRHHHKFRSRLLS